VTTSSYNVAVVGGGPAGLATAIALARDGLDVVVIERSGYCDERIGEHLPPSAHPLLRALGLADPLGGACHASCPGIRSVWGSAEPADKHYIGHPQGEGLNLTRPAFDLSLAALASSLGAEVITRCRVAGIAREARWRMTLDTGAVQVDIAADLVIDATGRAASIAKQLGARPIVVDGLVGIVGRTESSQVEDNSVIIEALETGWWYSAGLADGSVIATFLTDANLVELSAGGRRKAWLARLSESAITRQRCAALARVSHLDVRAARTQCLDRLAGDAWLAVGDAAMSFDPLSSEGISKGLYWARHAAAVASAWQRADGSALADYMEGIERSFDQYLVQRHRYYSLEKRWPHAPFWASRHVAPAAHAKRRLRSGNLE
jgi:flavin-dependent dehydrogenase